MNLGQFLVVAFGLLGAVVAPGPEHASLMCLSCNNIADPRDCSSLQHCGHHDHEQICYTEVIRHGDQVTYNMGCKPKHECDALTHIGIGRRNIACLKCCAQVGCNKDLCGHFLPTSPAPTTTMAPTTTTTTTTMAPTTTTTTTTTTTMAPTTTAPVSVCGVPPTEQVYACRDHEEDGFECSDYDVYNFCTDSTSFVSEIAHQKCPKHCGFCGVVSQATTTPDISIVTATSDATSPAPCVDREDASFRCSDKLDLCVDNSYYAIELAKDRCPKYCGLCKDNTDTTTVGGSMTTGHGTIPKVLRPLSMLHKHRHDIDAMTIA